MTVSKAVNLSTRHRVPAETAGRRLAIDDLLALS